MLVVITAIYSNNFKTCKLYANSRRKRGSLSRFLWGSFLIYHTLTSTFLCSSMTEKGELNVYRDRGVYNYLCNQCLSPLKLWVRTSFMAKSSINLHNKLLKPFLSQHLFSKCMYMYDTLYMRPLMINFKIFLQLMKNVAKLGLYVTVIQFSEV
jgi:hypothetical protein